jgi:hypothetical protein
MMNWIRVAAVAALAAIPGMSCTYTASIAPIPASGGLVYVSVNTQAGCTWMVSESSAFLSYYSARSGVGPGTTILYAQPDRGAARSTLVRILQSVQGGCDYIPGRTSIAGCSEGSFTKVVASATAYQY